MSTPTVDEFEECCGYTCQHETSEQHYIVTKKDLTTYGQSRFEEGVKAERERIVEIMENLVDDDLCTYDHHGYCQTHGWMSSSTCPHKLGQDYLTTPSEDNNKEI